MFEKLPVIASAMSATFLCHSRWQCVTVVSLITINAGSSAVVENPRNAPCYYY